MADEDTMEGFQHKGRVVRAEILAATPPERVWQAWTDPDRVAEWFPDRARGTARSGATVTWFFDRFKISVDYAILRAETGRHLVMKTRGPEGGAFVQEIHLAREAGGTRVKLASSGRIRNDEDHQGILSGWEMSLAIMKHYVEEHFGEPRRSFYAMQPAPVDYARMKRFFTEEWHLSRWLTASGSLPEAGRPYRLELRGGETMSGTVLAVTSHEAAVSWEEINGFLEMKAFQLGGPGQRAVCLRGSGWVMDSDLRLETERMLQGFIEKLVAALKEPTMARSGNGHGGPR